MQSTRTAVCRLVAMLAAMLPGLVAAAPIDDAESAYRSYKVTEAEELYRGVASDLRSSPRDRGQAVTELARIAWLVDGDYAAAKAALSRSLPVNPEPCPGTLLYARILNDEGSAADVPRVLASFVPRCAELEPGVPLQVVQSRLLRAAALPSGLRSPFLQAARDGISGLPPVAKAGLDASREAMDIGLLGGEGKAALAGWRAYFWLDRTDQPIGFSRTAEAIAAAFTNGTGPRRSAAGAAALAQILVQAGFATEAGWLMADNKANSGQADWKGVAAYLKMRAELSSVVLAYNRKHARNPQDDGKALQIRILEVLREGVHAAGGGLSENPWPALHTLWGLHGQIGVLNGVSGIMIGHAVEDRISTVEQGRRKGSIRYISLDNMIENSFSAWLWDGAGGPGGFALDGKIIYQVRPGYVRGTLKALAVALGGPPRAQALQEAAAASEADEARARGGSAVPLPGLGLRLRLRAIDAVAATARSEVTGEEEFGSSFRRRWWDLTLQSSIVLHEGRHVLDQHDFTGAMKLSDSELEFRGKLSEIGYSDLAPNALANVVGFEIDRTSSHGKANLRIIALYDDWIRAHASEIVGYRGDRPAGMQLDKLSDEQIRAVARSADPDNGEKPTSGSSF